MRLASTWQAKADQGYDNTHHGRLANPSGDLLSRKAQYLLDSPSRRLGYPGDQRQVFSNRLQPLPCPFVVYQGGGVPRQVTLRVQTDHEMLQQARHLQTTPEWKKCHERSSGIEGTIFQGTRGSGLRRSRYIGEAKTHLQHNLTACAIKLARFAAWKAGIPQAKTRISRFAALKAS